MNKIKTTKAEMRENYYIIGIGYCDLQYLLRFKNPVAYSSGCCGWSCDYYDIDGVIISTGYIPLNNKNVKFNYEIVRKYEQKARDIVQKYSYEQQEKKINKLLSKFISECKGVK
jgi:hypothetical protein